MPRSSKSEPTAQQAHAIEARGTSVVLSSGAGCGKTFVLTNRYLSHLKQDGVGVGQIVAITFTDRAAQQMRDRIRQAIAGEMRAGHADSSWAGHLRDLESAPIQTIHSFCGDLLRQFAVFAGLDPRFEVLEEILAENLRAEVLRDTLRALLTAETPAGRDLRELVVIYGWTAAVEAVAELLKERNAAAWEQWLKRSAAEVAKEWAGPVRDELLPVWVDYLCAASPRIAHLISLFRTTACRGPIMQANVEKVLNGLPRLAAAPDLATAVAELTDAAKVGTERAKAWPDAETYETIRDAMTAFRGELPKKLAVFLEAPDGVEEAARVGQRFIRVALTVAEAYQKRKAQAGVMDFQDLLVLARDLVRDRSEVKEYLRQRYRYLLLDEMQDTDPVQMEFVELLCGVGLEHDKLFAVGDSKQSIYRFRGADVSLFERLRARVPDDGRLQLSRNYRSQPGILHFVNALCSLRFPGYEPIEPHRTAAFASPCVEFLWSVPAGTQQSAGRETVADVRAREADAIARRIRELIASGADRVLDAGVLRSTRLGDIVLLFRSMSNVGIYEAVLRRHGLNYYLVGGRAFFAQQEVYDLLNLLRALENPADSVPLAGTLRSPFGCLSDDALVLLALHRGGLWAGLNDPAVVAQLPDDQRSRADRIRGLLTVWRGAKDRIPIAQLIGRVVADTGYDAALQFEILGDRKLANLWKMTDLARSFDRSGLFGLSEFIARIGELVATQPREEQAATQPENADVVRIMSIHQAKGLEFPVVFVPDLAAVGQGGRTAAARWDRRLGGFARPPQEDPPVFTDFPHRLGLAAETIADWQEDLRVLYVACTRAADLLVLSAGLTERLPHSPPDRPVPLKPTNSWMLALSERYQLGTGECLDQRMPAAERPKVAVRVTEPADLPPSHGRPEEHAGPEPGRWHIAAVPAAPWPAVTEAAAIEGRPGPDALTRAVRDALGRWDLSGPPPRSDQPEVAAMLNRFASSAWPARLRKAELLLRDVDFITPWPDRDEGIGRPAIRGVIDFLWKESDGWHLLALDAGEGRAPAAPALEAWVAMKQFGEPARTIATFDLQSGTETESSDEELDIGTVMRKLAMRLDVAAPLGGP